MLDLVQFFAGHLSKEHSGTAYSMDLGFGLK